MALITVCHDGERVWASLPVASCVKKSSYSERFLFDYWFLDLSVYVFGGFLMRLFIFVGFCSHMSMQGSVIKQSIPFLNHTALFHLGQYSIFVSSLAA